MLRLACLPSGGTGQSRREAVRSTAGFERATSAQGHWTARSMAIVEFEHPVQGSTAHSSSMVQAGKKDGAIDEAPANPGPSKGSNRTALRGTGKD